MLRLIIFYLFMTCNTFALTTYTVGVEDIDYSPIYSSTIGPRNFEGFTRDVLDRFAKSENIEFRYIPLPIKRFINVYEAGKLDFAFPDNPHWDKDIKIKKNINFSSPIIVFQDAIFVKPERLGKGADHLKVLGTLLGFSVWKFKEKVNSGKLTLASATTPEGLIKMGILGRVDGVNLAKPVVFYYLKQMDKPNALVMDPQLLPIKNSTYHISSIKYPQVIKKLDLFLRKDAVYINKLKTKYGL
jgi:polar amino acid transport system substrate-binding protein